ncbi:MAG: hypothetical protein HDS60_03825 [Barnesiella sp.]|nr:hypothetical protein [Barnesiella sp.]
MASKEQSVTLLRRNKRAQIEALNSLGFNLPESVRAADFPMYVKWASGLLDLNVAANRKSDNKKFFFTIEEWQSLSVSEQSLFLLRGIRIRACSVSFIIAPDTIQNKIWSPLDPVIPDIHPFQSRRDVFSYFDAYRETTLIAEALKNNSDSSAAEAALSYKAFTFERDGLNDSSEWVLPTPAHLSIMSRFINEINDAFTVVWSKDFTLMMIPHWACGRYSTNEMYYCDFGNGGTLTVKSPTTQYAVRPICAA